MEIGNFRCLGGMSTACGKKTAERRLLRSAQPTNLSEAALAQLRDYNVMHIIDFRTLYEVQTEPVTAPQEKTAQATARQFYCVF